MREFLAELQSRGRSLVTFGWFNLALALLFLIFWGSTDAAVMGINAWIKPLKFALSIALYSFTFAWLLSYLKSERHRNVIGWTLIVCMSAEILVIALQAARGETSHHNTSSPLNAALFATMGLFIGVNTVMNAAVWVLFMLPGRTTLESAQLLAWRAGLFFFFAGSLAGGLMIQHLAHTVGAADGGPGISFFNWSTRAGDLRIPHFFTMHGLQAVPLFWWLIGRHTSNPRAVVLGFVVIFALVSLLLHALALNGIPLFVD